MYWDPALPPADDGGPIGRIDLAGFSSAIESYEYSKQPMNGIAFESGAGTSLLFGPVLNPTGVTGVDALQLAQTWFVHMAGASNATDRFVSAQFSGTNVLGWPGLWPTLQPFSSWNPAIRPTHDTGCTISSDDDPGLKGALPSDNYECDYTSLHLPDRQAAVSMTIGPGSSGWTDWKEALWTLNYLQVMHGGHEDPVDYVPPSRLSSVGIPGNGVVAGVFPGVYLGSSDIEGFQAGNFIQILDNQAAQWLAQLTTADGATLGGFATLADALAYDTTGAARWFPAFHRRDGGVRRERFSPPFRLRDRVRRQPPARSGRPPGRVRQRVCAHRSGQHGGRRQRARARLLRRRSVPFAEPDARRGADPPRPGPRHGARARGEHGSPACGPRDGPLRRRYSSAFAARGPVLSSDVAAYALLSLRTARRALDSELTLYSNTTPDTAGIPSPLDGFPSVAGLPFSRLLDQLIGVLAGVFYDKLTSADGHAFAGWSRASGAPTDDGSSLDAHTAAIRGLLTAYLATGAVKYRDRAESVFVRLESSFYDPAARIYRTVAGDRSSQVTFTPRRFGLLQAALRDMYELVAVLPGNDSMRDLIEDRVGRLNKLVLNGWDDRDEDGLVSWPGECAHVGTGPDGAPLGLGGLQMAERTLSGETGSESDIFDAATRVIATDREHDCVPEISAVGLPSALANSITFALAPWAPGDDAAQSHPDGGAP